MHFLAPKIDHFGVRTRHRDSMLKIIYILSPSGPIWEPLGPHLSSKTGPKVDPGASQTASRRLQGLWKARGIDLGLYFYRCSHKCRPCHEISNTTAAPATKCRTRVTPLPRNIEHECRPCHEILNTSVAPATKYGTRDLDIFR